MTLLEEHPAVVSITVEPTSAVVWLRLIGDEPQVLHRMLVSEGLSSVTTFSINSGGMQLAITGTFAQHEETLLRIFDAIQFAYWLDREEDP